MIFVALAFLTILPVPIRPVAPGELGRAAAWFPFVGLVIARPSMLVGNREELGQPVRRGEVVASVLGTIGGFLIPANYKPIEASAVARALLSQVPSASGMKVLLSGAMRV